MNKKELVDNIASDSGITKSQAELALKSFISNVTSTLENNEGDSAKITLVGFGTFKKVRREKRMGQNPQTSEKMEIPAHNAVVFRAGKNLTDTIKPIK